MTEVPFDDLNPGDRVRVVFKPNRYGDVSTADGNFAGFGKCLGFPAIVISQVSLQPGWDAIMHIKTREIDKVLRLGK